MRVARLPKGATLLETVLALAVVAVVLSAGMTLYGHWQQQVFVEQERYNLKTLFQAMTAYYRAQCGSGTLASAPTTKPYAVSQAALAPYLPTNWHVTTPLMSNYAVQFNPTVVTSPAITVTACVVQTPGTACVPTTSTLPTTQAQVVIWDSQVALIPNATDTGSLSAYQDEFGASCLSTLVSGVVTPCAQVVGNAGTYLVFQQLPSANTDIGGRGYWLSTPMLKQFQLQYTHDQMYELIPNGNTVQNYMCGA